MSAIPKGKSESPLVDQDQFLEGVSRTFALTIPALPEPLRVSVTNAYLLCRIADTIEDDPGLDAAHKRSFGKQFVDVVAGREDAAAFAGALAPHLSGATLDAEKELIANTASVIAVTHSLPDDQQAAIEGCIDKMSQGMYAFQRRAGLHGLRDQDEMDAYCYFVAGVVGEMLTELFCSYCPEIRQRRELLMRLAPSFGQGLQMTNILKDVWEDRKRGACWLPRAGFRMKVDLTGDLVFQAGAEELQRGLARLVAQAHGHLRNALEYTLALPPDEKGIRRFCLWALGMAVLTLRKINRNPHFQAGSEVKITRRTVRMVVGLSGSLASRNAVLRALFAAASAGLPSAEVEGGRPALAVAQLKDSADPSVRTG